MKPAIYFLIFVVFASCSVFDGSKNLEMELRRSWEIEHFFDKAGEQLSLNHNEPLMLRFLNATELDGEADCNVFGGEYKAKNNGDISIKSLYATEIACEQPTLGSEYLETLASITNFKLEKGRLILSYDRKGKLIFLERLE